MAESFFKLEKRPDRTALLLLNRPQKRNAMEWAFWKELPEHVEKIENDPDIRSAVIAGEGKSFSTGLDIPEFFSRFKGTLQGASADEREKLYKLILDMQKGLNAIADGKKIYIAAVHRHCIGGGLDLIAACDIRLACQDAAFSLREAKVAIVADMGSLNRLPGIIGMGNTALMAYTGGDFDAAEAQRMGLVSRVYETREKTIEAALKLAVEIAENPAIAVRGTKDILRYSRSHSVEDGLKYVAAWNSAFLDSEDLRELVAAFTERRKPRFQ